MDRGAWWAAVYGVAQSRTRLKRLSSSRLKKTVRKLNDVNWWGIGFGLSSGLLDCWLRLD